MKTPQSLKIRKVAFEEFSKAQEFYSSVGYHAKINEGCKVLSAFLGDEIVGVVRLANENNVLVLRGMMICNSQQRKGLGSLMLKELEKEIREVCYCLPHDWLEDFYGQIGFHKISESSTPRFLQERLQENRKKHPHLIIMRRDL